MDRLQSLYPNPPIPLQHKDPYTLLIAVLLSAQCTDERVNQITPALFALADTPDAMAKLDVAEIQAIIRPCGLSPQKSKAIKQLSQILLDKHQGQVPQDFEALEALPGVGHKTASVVMSQAFGVPAFPVDTHIRMRWWQVPAGSVPHDPGHQVEWLYEWWRQSDAWISTHRPTRSPASRSGETYW